MSDTIHLKAQLIVTGYIGDPEKITSIIGLESTEIHEQGEVRRKDPQGLKPPILYEKNVWVHQFEPSADSYTQGYVDQVINELSQHTDALISISESAEIELSIYGNTEEGSVGLNLDPAMIKKLAAMNISFDFDVYKLEE